MQGRCWVDSFAGTAVTTREQSESRPQPTEHSTARQPRYRVQRSGRGQTKKASSLFLMCQHHMLAPTSQDEGFSWPAECGTDAGAAADQLDHAVRVKSERGSGRVTRCTKGRPGCRAGVTLLTMKCVTCKLRPQITQHDNKSHLNCRYAVLHALPEPCGLRADHWCRASP